MNSWIAAALTLTISGPVALLLGALNRSKGDQVEIMTLTLERNDARSQRDRLNTENAAYHQAINEAQAVISRLEVQALALQKENAALALQLQEATRPRKRTRGQALNTEIAQ